MNVHRALRHASLLGSLVVFAASPAAAQPADEPAEPAAPAPAPQPEPEPDKPAPDKGGPRGEELAAARQLFKDGLEHEKADEWDKALAAFERVSKVKMTPAVRYHLALCHENLGNLVKALNLYELAHQEAAAAGGTARDVEKNAPARAKELRKKVGYVRIQVRGTVRTSKILLDGKPIILALAGTKLPVNPGTHKVEVERDGKIQVSMELTLAAGEEQTAELDIDDPEPNDVPPPPPPPKPVKPPPEPPPSRVPAYITAGVGAGAIVAGGVYFALREQALNAIAETCDDPANFTGCDPDIRPTEENARDFTTASGVLFAAGGAAVVTGVALWFILAPEDTPDDAKPAEAALDVRVVPSVGPGFTGMQVLGQF